MAIPGRRANDQNRIATRNRTGISNANRNPKVGTCFVHTVIDDHTHIAYAECHDDETAATAAAVLCRAVAWFAERGVVVERVLSDDGSAYRSHLWVDTCADLGITTTRTGPYRPRPTGASRDSTAP